MPYFSTVEIITEVSKLGTLSKMQTIPDNILTYAYLVVGSISVM